MTEYFLFQETKETIIITNSPPCIVCDDRIIIDNILLFSNHVSTILHYFLALHESLSIDFTSN